MSGCLRRLGCLVLLLVLGAGAFVTRDLWWERVTGRPVVDTRDWQSPAASAPRLSDIQRGRGGAWVSLTPAELAALLRSSVQSLPVPVRDPQVAISGDRVSIRGRVSLGEVAVARELGPLAQFLRGEQTVVMTGRPRVERKGEGVLVVEELRVGAADVPAPLIRGVVRQLGADAGTDAGGREVSISFSLPPTVGDMRVARGRLTIYRDVP